MGWGDSEDDGRNVNTNKRSKRKTTTTITKLLPTPCLKHRIASFLTYQDVLRMMSVGQQQQEQHGTEQPFQELAISVLNPPQEIFFSQIFRSDNVPGGIVSGGSGTTSNNDAESSLSTTNKAKHRNCERIPILFKHQLIHSFKLSCQYKDQGYGERVGRILVIRKRHCKNHDNVAPSNSSSSSPSRDNKDIAHEVVVYTSPLAPHQYEDLEIIIYPSSKNNHDSATANSENGDDWYYELQFHVNSDGDGNTTGTNTNQNQNQNRLLHVENLHISTVVFDTTSSSNYNLLSIYKWLCKCGFLDIEQEEEYDDDEEREDDRSENQHPPNLLFGTKLLLVAIKALQKYQQKPQQQSSALKSVLTNYFESSGLLPSSQSTTTNKTSTTSRITASTLCNMSKVCQFFLQHITTHDQYVVDNSGSKMDDVVFDNEDSSIDKSPFSMLENAKSNNTEDLVDNSTNGGKKLFLHQRKSLLPSFPLLAYASWEGPTIVQDIRIPVLFPLQDKDQQLVVRITGKCAFKGSGKCQLYLLSKSKSTKSSPSRIHSREIMMIENAKSTFDFSFSPQLQQGCPKEKEEEEEGDDKTRDTTAYFLRIQTIGNNSDDHYCLVEIENVILNMTILTNCKEGIESDGEDLKNVYCAFQNCGALDTTNTGGFVGGRQRIFHLSLLKAVIDSMIMLWSSHCNSSNMQTKGELPDDFVYSFLKSCGFPLNDSINKDTLVALKESIQSLLDFYNEKESKTDIVSTREQPKGQDDDTGQLRFWTQHAAM